MEICFANLYIKFCIDIFHAIHEGSRKFGIGQVSDSFFKGYAKKGERMTKILRRIFTYLMRNDALSLLFSRWRTFLDSEIDVILLLFRQLQSKAAL